MNNEENTEEQDEQLHNDAVNEDMLNADSAPQEESEINILEAKNTELNDKYLRLYSEFENFRKRTAKERLDLFATAGKDIIVDLLPVLDDFERAMKNASKEQEFATFKTGVELIYNKFKNTLENKGLKPFVSLEKTFDPEIHEAVTKIPAPHKKLKGKVVDEIEKGYELNDKVIRYAKVVIGE